MIKKIYRIVLLSILCFNAYSNEVIVVAYPESSPYQTIIFNRVIAGIQSQAGQVNILEIPAISTSIQSELDHIRPNVIIALTTKAAELVIKSTYRDNVIVGIANFKSDYKKGVDLVIDSQALSVKVARVLPSVKSIHVFQDPRYKSVNRNLGSNKNTPRVVLYETDDMVDMIRTVGQFLEREATQHDLIFLPTNLPVDMLYEITKVAWDKKILLTSMNMSFLERGTLMVCLPDEKKLGEQLGGLTKENLARIEPISAIQVGLNRHIAQHLSIDVEPANFAFSIK